MHGTAKITAGARIRRTALLLTAAIGLLLHAGLATTAMAAGGIGGSISSGPMQFVGGSGGSGGGGAGATSTAPGQQVTGGAGGAAYQGAAPTQGGGRGGEILVSGGGNSQRLTGGSGGTAYKGVGAYAGTGGGSGGTLQLTQGGMSAAATGGAGGGIGAGGGAGSGMFGPNPVGQAGGAAGANGNGAGTPGLNNAAPLVGGAGGTPGAIVGLPVATGGGGAGGIGALVTGAGPGTNTSTIQGGAGGNGGPSNPPQASAVGGGGAGGFGAVFTAGTTQFDNSGIISGGNGGSGGATGAQGGGGGGAGGVGVLFGAGGTQFINSNMVAGGNGGSGGAAMVQGGGGGGEGGSGALFVGDDVQMTNIGTVLGGSGGDAGRAFGVAPFPPNFQANGGGGGGAGGAGVLVLGNRVAVTNDGNITGGAGGAFGASAAAGVVTAGGGGGAGGSGALFVGNDVQVTNNGTIVGGAGGGISGNARQTIQGGGGGGGGGDGLLVTGDHARLANTMLIAGGNGGASGPPAAAIANLAGSGGGGEGGTAARFGGSDARVTNSGRIVGGNGGSAGTFANGSFAAGVGGGGDGGAGIQFLGSGARLVNSSVISGGNGGTTATAIPPGGVPPGIIITNGVNGVGGVGVIMSGGTIDNSGTISGGLAGNGVTRAFAIALQGGENFVGGSGQINGGIFVGADASFQPALNGTTPGTPLNVNGPVFFAPGSFYNVRITPTGNDRAIANGADGVATLTGAGVNASFANGTYQTGRYTILTANAGLVGQFATLSTTLNSAFLSPFLSYDPNNVYLNIAVTNPIVTPGGRVVPNYVPAAITYNQIAVANGLTQAGIQNNGRGPLLNALNQLSAPQARAAFDALSGEGITGAQNSAFRQSQLFTSSIFDQTTFYSGAANSVTLCEDPIYGRLVGVRRDPNCQPIRELADLPARQFQPIAPAAANRTWRAWATGFGGTEHLSGNAFPTGSAGQNNSLYGGSLGVDYQLLPNYLVGVAVGGSNGDFRVDQRGTYGTTTGGHIAIYDVLTLGNWYGASSSSFSFFGNKTTRFVSGFGGLGSETLRGNFDSNEFRSRLEIGRHFSSLPFFGGLPALSGFGTVTPFVALEIASLRSNGFTEYATRGAGLFRLNVSGQSIGSAPGYAGLRFQRVTPLGNGMVLSPTLQLAYVHEFAPYRNQIGTLASLPGSTFLVDGARPARDAAQVKAGAELAINAHSAVFANFDGEFSGVNQLYAGKGGFRYVW